MFATLRALREKGMLRAAPLAGEGLVGEVEAELFEPGDIAGEGGGARGGTGGVAEDGLRGFGDEDLLQGCDGEIFQGVGFCERAPRADARG